MFKKAVGTFLFLILSSSCSLTSDGAAVINEIRSAPVVIGNVCGFFPKEIVEEAVKKPIVLVEPGGRGKAVCRYYTEYQEAEAGDEVTEPLSGKSIIVSYETIDPATIRDKVKAEGNSWQRSMFVPVDNMVIRESRGDIQQIYLFVDLDRVVRLQYKDEAIDSKAFMRLATALADRLRNLAS